MAEATGGVDYARGNREDRPARKNADEAGD